MINRPKYITVISWILIVASIISVVFALGQGTDGLYIISISTRSLLPIYIITFLYLSPIIISVSGVAMLNAKWWSRFLYIGWNVTVFIISKLVLDLVFPFSSAPSWGITLIPQHLIFIIAIFFLFLPKANAYFRVQR